MIFSRQPIKISAESSIYAELIDLTWRFQLNTGRKSYIFIQILHPQMVKFQLWLFSEYFPEQIFFGNKCNIWFITTILRYIVLFCKTFFFSFSWCNSFHFFSNFNVGFYCTLTWISSITRILISNYCFFCSSNDKKINGYRTIKKYSP